MADFTLTPNTSSDLDDLNVNFNMDPSVFGEDFSNENQGTNSQSEEGVVRNAVVGNLPVSDDNDPFMNPGSLTTNKNFDPSLPVSDDNDPFVGTLGLEPNQDAANFPSVEEEDWFKPTSEQQEEEFHRLMEMSPEDFEETMSKFPDGTPGPSSATPSAMSKKRAHRDEEDFAATSAESAPIAPQPAFEPQQVHQIRQIREVKSLQGKAIEGLRKRVRDLEVNLAKSQAEVNDAFENGRMMTLLGLNDEWEAKEAKIKGDAEFEHQQQVGAVHAALTQKHGQLEEANREIAEKNKKLDQYRAEADAYKTNIEGEARRYKQAAEKEIEAQKEAVKAAGEEKNRAETQLSEQMRVLDLAKPYIEGLERKVAELKREKGNWEAAEPLREQNAQTTAIRALEGKIQELEASAEKTKGTLGESEMLFERLDGAKARAENACADQKKLLDESQSYVKDLERRLADLGRELSSKEAVQRRREEELQKLETEACKALEGKIKNLEATAEKAIGEQDKSAQANKSLNKELHRLSGDLKEVQSALKTKTDELEKARSAIEEQAKAQSPQQLRQTRSIVGPLEQVNIEPSHPHPTNAGMPSVTNSFTFVAAKELPPSQLGSRQIRSMKSRRQLQTLPQPKSPSRSKQEQEAEPEPEPKTTSPSQLGMFSRHSYPPVPANRPRRSHIHPLEAIRNRLHIPLEKVITIVSKLDKIGDWQDGMADKAGLIISAELTGLSIDDLKVMQSLRMTIPGSSRNPLNVMRSAQLEIPRTLVDLLASDDRPTISAFLDGASFLQSRASSEIARGIKSQGTQTDASHAEAAGNKENMAVQKELAMERPDSKQFRGWPRSGFAYLWKILILLSIFWFILPLLMPLPWSSPAAWFFEDPDPNSGWFDYVPEPSPWSGLLPDFSRWPIISKFLDFLFDDPDLESKWCGNIPIG